MFDSAKIDKYYNGRCCGQVVRPVCHPPAPLAPAKRIGIFSVASDRQVSFSQGNLQYTQSTKTWQFADNQYDYIGEDNIKDGQLANRIDLFGWSGVNSNAPWGVSTSSNIADYVGDFLDWGTNTISGDEPGLWRLLSADEWHYLLHLRPNAKELFAEAIVNSIPGMILLPDNWQSIDGIPFIPSVQSGMKQVSNPLDTYRYQDYFVNKAQGADHYQDNKYTLDQWNRLEEAGAVFLPTTGWREKNLYNAFEGTPPAKNAGVYWSSTKLDSKNVLFFRHCDSEIGKCFNDAIYRGRSVRLVHDTIVEKECSTFTQEEWDGAVNLWGHAGRAHAPADQSCIQGTYVNGIRLKIGRAGNMNVYKVPSLLETTEDNFELVATLTTDSLGVRDFDFPTPIYVAENECLVFGKASEDAPTLFPYYHNTLSKQPFAHYIGTDKAKIGTKVSLMVEFY